MEQPDATQFKAARATSLTMAQAIAQARRAMAEINDLPVDSIIRSERAPDGSWTVALELVESAARMGENDALTAYELRLDADGTMIQLDRIGRYRREESQV